MAITVLLAYLLFSPLVGVLFAALLLLLRQLYYAIQEAIEKGLTA